MRQPPAYFFDGFLPAAWSVTSTSAWTSGNADWIATLIPGRASRPPGHSPELDDAARVDGCSRLGALVRILLPVSTPGIVSTGLVAFLLAWDEFFYALVMTQTNAAKTLPVALNDHIGRRGIDIGMLATGGVIAAIPPILIAFVFQRYLVAGLTAGGVNG